ncbi:HlyD family efflux transporter periplasmic adaptor subunit [cf. Phormidesmis sp. LEGE 11477]|uniref:HlyD family efflux transporter periplasmic adaptor subunit n=1 Tax=cf. Phormidesmis sp. LEGE 11477 TaxID=1828680 RepID=UPI00187EE93F|nr:HlyD family efflux transporter periplasmic adaptor subunit [cf. Phormidesmis sp. LEGE 11477]MBE9063509.1 HlyD family efflux transporter periplasmic adaptor subunit [cf. Phormidesmis sp. LEGE 11477]
MPRSCWIFLRWALFASAGLLCTACTSSAMRLAEDSLPQDTLIAASQSARVVALGQIQPEGEVIQLSVPNAEDSRVNQILVEECDFVEADQVIAVLQGFERRDRDLQAAQKTVELQRAELARLLAGEGKASEIAAKQAAIAELEARQRNQTMEEQAAIDRAEAELQQARITQERNLSLVQSGALSQAQLDQSTQALASAEAVLVQRQAQLNNTMQTMVEQISQERNLLETLREVRPTDIAVFQAELEQAEISVAQRQADLEETQVRVPVPGQILRINTRVGERVNTQEGIIELGNTRQMMAIAEIYETDIDKVAVGQSATLTSEYGGFDDSLKAEVTHVGLQIGSRSLSNGSTNPTADENQRVVEVRLRIDPADSPKVSSLTNMQVRVEIETDAPRGPL